MMLFRSVVVAAAALSISIDGVWLIRRRSGSMAIGST